MKCNQLILLRGAQGYLPRNDMLSTSRFVLLQRFGVPDYIYEPGVEASSQCCCWCLHARGVCLL